MKKKTSALLWLAPLWALACDGGGDLGENLVLSTQAPLEASMEGVLYQIDCAPIVELDEPVVMVHLEQFVPFHEGAAPPWLLPDTGAGDHAFADYFAFVDAPAQCTVTATAGNWNETTGTFEPSENCEPGTAQIDVFEGQTVEELIVINCTGDASGALDNPVILNNCPEIVGLTNDEKFFCEGDGAEIALEVIDPDGDAVTCEWQVVGAPDGATPTDYAIVPAVTTDATGHTVEFNSDAVGGYDLLVECTDVFGECATSFEFPMYPIECDGCECPEGYEPVQIADGTECMSRITVDAKPPIQDHEPMTAKDRREYTVGGALYPDGTTSHADAVSDFWGDTTSIPNNRLNVIGVRPSPVAYDEWIGFSVCIDEPGDYLVGIAGEHMVRVELNGNVVYDQSSSTAPLANNFRFWHIVPLDLVPGANTVHLEVRHNSATVGNMAFGAEIYGPFPSNSLVDDASMESADLLGNILFSTAGLMNSEDASFDTGEHSGIVCPPGFEVGYIGADGCSTEASCTLFATIPCGEKPICCYQVFEVSPGELPKYSYDWMTEAQCNEVAGLVAGDQKCFEN